MAENLLEIELATPEQFQLFENVISCSAPGVLGGFQVLLKHASLISQLEIGEIKIQTQGKDLIYSTSGGFLEVNNNKLHLLLDSCELASNIDLERAASAKKRAEERLETKSQDIDVDRAKLALLRALNRIKIAKKVSERV
jgi:F-type H+-transporting ATPase subunit epsilon